VNRRELLLSAAALTLPATVARATEGRPADKGKLRILILGGTGFIGPHFLREAQARGHTVTLFNRGKRQETPTPGVETLIGDRDGQLEALKGRDWDVVIDNSGYVPRHVRLTTQLLRERVRHYLFISTISVYADLSVPGVDEDAPLKKLTDPTVEKVDGETYGGLKALCEAVVLEDFAGRNTIVRPTYIVGPGDHTDRFTYWPWRVSQGGTMLAPGTAPDPIQYIDVRDLARFVIGCVEAPTPGIFNACSPPGFATMGGLLETSRRVSGANTEFRWVDEATLRAEGLLEGPALPIWSPPSGESAGVALVSPARAVGAGLRFTPLEDTVRATLEWHRSRPAEQRDKLKVGLSREAEAALLAKLRP
jgi:2'-hydroxyisoflavone reductase